MIPETSTTLLRNVRDAEHPRWPEFVAKYRPMMEAYLKAHFPALEADDVIQETFAALCGILPGYIYAPDEKGHFRNYLTGILRNKARRPFGDARLPVRHCAAGAEVPSRHQTTQPKNEVLTSDRDLTTAVYFNSFCAGIMASKKPSPSTLASSCPR